MRNPKKVLENPMVAEYFFALSFHYLGYIIMQTLAVLGETVRGPTLPDRMHEWVVANREYAIWNNQIWIAEFFIFLLILSIFRTKEAINYLRVGGVVSVFRGIFIFLTTLGPTDANQPLQLFSREMITWKFLLNFYIPISGIFSGEMSVFYLTQDLFFSGHTATTFLFLLAYRNKDFLFYIFLIYHFQTVFFFDNNT